MSQQLNPIPSTPLVHAAHPSVEWRTLLPVAWLYYGQASESLAASCFAFVSDAPAFHPAAVSCTSLSVCSVLHSLFCVTGISPKLLFKKLRHTESSMCGMLLHVLCTFDMGCCSAWYQQKEAPQSKRITCTCIGITFSTPPFCQNLMIVFPLQFAPGRPEGSRAFYSIAVFLLFFPRKHSRILPLNYFILCDHTGRWYCAALYCI